MAETEVDPRDQETSDDDFEMVVRKRRSNSKGFLKFASQNRERNFRPFRSTRRFFSDRDHRADFRKFGERDRDKYNNNNIIPSHQQPPTNGYHQPHPHHSSFNHIRHHKSACAGVTNGSICSDGASSDSAVNSTHSVTNTGTLDVDPSSHIRHLSGTGTDSGSGCASVSDGDHDPEAVAQTDRLETACKSSSFEAAPAPVVNPWRVNANAASVISKKTPAAHRVNLEHAKTKQQQPATNLTEVKHKSSDIPSQSSHLNTSTCKNTLSSKASETILNANACNCSCKGSPVKCKCKCRASNTGSPEISHICHKSDECSSETTTSSLSDATSLNSDIAQITTDTGKLEIQVQYVDAPPPVVNPWKSRSSIDSGTSGKEAVKQSQNFPQVSQKAGPNKRVQEVQSATCQSASNTSATSLASHGSSQTQTTSMKIDMTKEPDQRRSFDVQVKPLSSDNPRAFSKITRDQKSVHSTNSYSPAEYWPSLQETSKTQTSSTPTPEVTMSTESVIVSEGGVPMTTEPETDVIITANASNFTNDNHTADKLTAAEKWPSVADAYTKLKENGEEISWHSSSEENTNDNISSPAKSEQNKSSEIASLTSSEDYDNEKSTENEDGDAAAVASRKSKKNKQKWVPLPLPEPPSVKHRLKKERLEREKDKSFKAKEETKKVIHADEKFPPADKLKINVPSKRDTRFNGCDNKSTYVYPPRGRGRFSGVRSRPSRLRNGVSTPPNTGNFPMTGIPDSELSPTGEEFLDYPQPEYTTLPPMYPVTDYIMPYVVNNGFYDPRAQPPVHVESSALTNPCMSPVEDTTIMDMVRKQMEYYFSEENLDKDFYLRRKMNSEGYLPVTFIATFPRVKIMTEDVNLVTQAIQSSKVLELSQDMAYVRTRTEPYKWPIKGEPNQYLACPEPYFYTDNLSSELNYQHMNGDSARLSANFSGDSCIRSFGNRISDRLNPNVPEFVPKSNVTSIA